MTATPDHVVDPGARMAADFLRPVAEEWAASRDDWADETLAVRPDVRCLERWLDLNA